MSKDIRTEIYARLRDERLRLVREICALRKYRLARREVRPRQSRRRGGAVEAARGDARGRLGAPRQRFGAALFVRVLADADAVVDVRQKGEGRGVARRGSAKRRDAHVVASELGSGGAVQPRRALALRGARTYR